MDDLTKDSQKILKQLYALYKEKCNSGSSKEKAAKFPKDFYLDCKSLSDMHPDDISTCLSELNQLNYIHENITGSFSLQSKSIVAMENRLKNNLETVTNIISAFK